MFLGWFASYEYNPSLSFPIADFVFFDAELRCDGPLYTLVYNPSSLIPGDDGFEGYKGMLSYHSQQTGRINTDGPVEPEDQAQFVVQYLDFFRRGCWLSGCNIEASAHEKAEWMQGFSQEEVKAWNLKM